MQCEGRKQSGRGGQTKPIFREKAKTTKTVQRLELAEPSCRAERALATMRGRRSELEGDGRKKGHVAQF